MRTNAWNGALAGIAGGIVFGIMMQIMTAPTPEGGRMPMMAMVAAVVRSDSIFVGWVYHLFNSALIGALFGLFFGSRVTSGGAGLGWGAAWGAVWWVIGGLLLMPVLLGMPPLAPLQMAPMRPVAIGSLVGHVIYGLITGLVFSRLHAGKQGSPATATRSA